MSDEELAISILTSTGCIRTGGRGGIVWVGDGDAEDKATRVAGAHAGRPQLLATLYRIIASAKAARR